uniref:Uncharacterized protein n=1 Tax=Romanomermis culicivorax TaxID=13658 RepID=A0A915KQ62_ROMCU
MVGENLKYVHNQTGKREKYKFRVATPKVAARQDLHPRKVTPCKISISESSKKCKIKSDIKSSSLL